MTMTIGSVSTMEFISLSETNTIGYITVDRFGSTQAWPRGLPQTGWGPAAARPSRIGLVGIEKADRCEAPRGCAAHGAPVPFPCRRFRAAHRPGTRLACVVYRVIHLKGGGAMRVER